MIETEGERERERERAEQRERFQCAKTFQVPVRSSNISNTVEPQTLNLYSLNGHCSILHDLAI